MVIGSIAGSVHGRVSWPRDDTDVDLFMREPDAYRGLDALADAGFRPEVPPGKEWLAKAWKDDVLVDLIYRAAGRIEPDDRMFARARRHRIANHEVVVISPEDYVVMQSCTHSYQTKEHWFNALDAVMRSDIDWDYLVERAREAGRERALSLLLYARSDGIDVPNRAIEKLSETRVA
jgi:hypothetical protein